MDAHTLAPLLGDWARERGPLYRRLAGALLDTIRRGDVAAGERLPSERELAVALSLSRTTTVAAYRALKDAGVVVAVQGSGTRVVDGLARPVLPMPPAVMPALKLLAPQAPDIIDCSNSVLGGLPQLPDEVLRVSASELRRLGREYVYEPAGLPVLRGAIAERYDRLGLPTQADQVLVTTGAQQAISLACAHFAGRGSAVVVEDPTYFGALDAIRAAGARAHAVAVDGEGPALQELTDAAGSPGARLIYVMPSCHNPTGTVMTGARREALVSIAREGEIPIVDDMTLADLVHGSEPVRPLAAVAGDRVEVITISSLSKAFWPGLRVGWLRASKPVVDRLARLKVVSDLGSSHVSQLIAARIVASIDELSAFRRQQLTSRLELFSGLLSAQLPEWSWKLPQGGPCLWVRLPYGDGESFAQLALRHGVRVLPGAKMSPGEDSADRLRVSFVAEPEQLQEAVVRLRGAWTAYSTTDVRQRGAIDVVV